MEFLPTLTSQIDQYKPSLFELLSSNQLEDLIPPSLRYVLALLTHRHPRYLLRILNNFDEVYALLGLVVEKYYLENFGGGFVENFYGLKREKILSVRGGEVRRAALGVPNEVRERVKISARRGDVWRNLLVMIGIPYLKRKLDESYDIHIAPSAGLIASAAIVTEPSAGLGGGAGGPRYVDRDALPPDATPRQKIMWAYKWFLRHVYPSVNAAYYFSILAFSLGYLFDGTKYSNPFMWVIGTRIRRMGGEDYRAIEEAGKVSLAAAMGTPADRPGQGLAGFFHPKVFWPKLLSGLRLFLPASVFALKFLEWWHASDFSRQLTRKAAEGLELPPPIVSGMDRGVNISKDTTTQRGQQREQQEGDTSRSHSSSPNFHSKPNFTSTSTSRPRTRKRTKTKNPPPPISNTTFLPIFTVPAPTTTSLCPICLHPIETAAACQTGHIFDYKCLFQWVDGNHERQEAFMRGEKMSEWEDDDDDDNDDDIDDEIGHAKVEDGDESKDKNVNDDNDDEEGHGHDTTSKNKQKVSKSREGEWESGKGRCPVTGRRVLGGTGGIRRVLV